MRRVTLIALVASVLILPVGLGCSKKSSSKRQPPLVTNVVPASGFSSSFTSVTITGLRFNGAILVALDDPAAMPLTGVAVVSNTEIQASVPPGVARGLWNVQVTTPPGTNATSTPRFRVVGAPTVTDVTPSSGMDNVTTPVTITGTDFVGVTGVALDDAATTALTGMTTVNDTTITATVPSGVVPGFYNVRVTNPAGTNATSAVLFQVIASATPPPTVVSITPTTGMNNVPTPVTITGTNFIGTVTARLDDPATTQLTGVVVGSTTQITADVPTGIAAGTWEVRVSADGGLSPVAGVTFDVTAPYIGPSIFVTQSETNDVLVVNLTTRQAEYAVPVGQLPIDIAITPNEAELYITNSGSGTVSVIETATNTVVASIPVGGGPAAVDFSPSGAEAYVANATTSDVSVIDVASRTVVDTIPVSADPGELEFRRPQGDEVWVLASGAADSNLDPVDVIDPTTRTVTTTIPTVGINPLGIAFDQTGDTAYVACVGNLPSFVLGDIREIDVATRAVSTITLNPPLGSAPFEIARIPGSDTAYINDATSTTVLLFDTATGAQLPGGITLAGGFSLGWGRIGFAPATDRAFTLCAEGAFAPYTYSLWTIDTTSDTTVSPSLSLGTTNNPPNAVVVKEN